MSGEWFERRRFLVSGGAGFLGTRIVAALEARGADEVFVPRSHHYDLREFEACEQAFAAARPDVLIHAAASVGGIGATSTQPATFFYDNAAMGLHIVEAARRAGVEKVVTAGSVCSYPADTPVPFRESTLWDGYPEQTNAPYGLAKKLTLVQQQAYRAQHGLAGAYLLLANLYGPGDDFHPESSHVIPALIRKFSAAVEQQAPAVAVWGSGEATREFLYVDDAAEAIVSAAERYDSPEPLNIGSGSEISIRALAECIARLSGFAGRLEFDRSRPEGQARRSLDVSRARNALGWEAQTALEDGLRRTLVWWRGEASEQAA